MVGLVGESGCGKSVTALALVGLLRPPGRITGGSVRFGGRDLTVLSEPELRRVRGRGIAMIFQAPRESLNPVLTIGQQLGLLLARHDGIAGRPAALRARELIEMVELPDPGRVLRAYPHELSGGMCQRAMIALALACRPALLIADEATTALDVTVQLQILLLLQRLRGSLGLAQLLITHNLGVVAEACQRVAVMYAGEIVETAAVGELFADPRHPYARRLLAARPRVGAPPEGDPIPGSVPDPIARPPGCAFHPRCHRAQASCAERHPTLDALAPGREVRCHYPEPPADGEAVLGEPPGRPGPVEAVPGRKRRLHPATDYGGGPRLVRALRRGDAGPRRRERERQVHARPLHPSARAAVGGDGDLRWPRTDGAGWAGTPGRAPTAPDGLPGPGRVAQPPAPGRLHRGRAAPAARAPAAVRRRSGLGSRSCSAGSASAPSTSTATRTSSLVASSSGSPSPARWRASRGSSPSTSRPRRSTSRSQAALLALLRDVQARLGLAYLFISHDLAVVSTMASRVMVMYLGQVVEAGPTAALLAAPRHPYTRALVSAIPRDTPWAKPARLLVAGEPGSALAHPTGCRFASRCPWALERCAREPQPLRPVGLEHAAACWRVAAGELPAWPAADPRRP